MKKQYDRIFRENFEDFFIPFIERHLNIQISSATEISQVLVRTLERKPDFLKMVETSGGSRFILHVEMQTANDHKMLNRMRLYHALLMDAHQLPVRQLVLYMGTKASRMRTKSKQPEIFSGFELLEISKVNADEFLSSKTMGETILAILSDFGGRDKRAVIKLILSRLRQLKADKNELEKALHQLLIFANISNLVDVVRNEIENMPVTIDIRKSSIYKEGKIEGKAEGKIETQTKIALSMLETGKYSLEEISGLTQMSLADIEALRSKKA